MRGTIEKITVKKGNTNGKEWTLNRLKINGYEYSKWGNCPFQVGDEVEFNWEQDGKYKKITSIKKVNNGDTEGGNGSGNESTNENYDLIVEMLKRLDSRIRGVNSVVASIKLAIEVEEKGLDLNNVMDKARVIYLAMRGKKVELKDDKENNKEEETEKEQKDGSND